jgi:hypothetical protein
LRIADGEAPTLHLSSSETKVMGKHLVGLVWDLPASFVLPSLAACRRAIAYVKPRSGIPQLAHAKS